MCSIFKYKTVVGRNFDYEVSYNEEMRVIESKEYGNQYKIIGMCTGVVKDYPLLYDGMNEHGLVMGGLAFSGNAEYYPNKNGMINIPSFDLILRVLGNFTSVSDVKSELDVLNISDDAYSDELPPSDLHWFIADKDESIIIEQTKDGLHYYNGDVMTNNPPYLSQKDRCAMLNRKIMKDDMNLLRLSESQTRGTETLGLCGDYTSDGRFARLTWLKQQLETHKNNFNSVSQAFHLCSSVEQVYGATPVDDKYEYTIYSVIYDMENKIIYFKYYDDILYLDCWSHKGFSLEEG